MNGNMLASHNVPDFVPDFSQMGPAMPSYAEQLPVAPAVEAPPENPAAQSFRERWGERIGEAVAVAKQVGAIAVEGLVSMVKDDQEGTANDADMPVAHRVIERAQQAESMPTGEAGPEDRTRMWASRIVKGAGYALTAAKVYKLAKRIR